MKPTPLEYRNADGEVRIDPASPKEIRKRNRNRALMVLIACVLFCSAAYTVAPRSRGFGTHRQWSLPSCTVLIRTGYPCPTCGMTTSVSAAWRGRFITAFRAQPFGTVLVLWAIALTILAVMDLAGTDRLRWIRFDVRWIIGGLIVLWLGWMTKIIAGIATGVYPLE